MRTRVIIAAMAIAIINLASGYKDREFQCTAIKERYSPTKQELRINRFGLPTNFIIYWGSDPARAAAALFTIVLRNALGLQHVQLTYGPHKLSNLIAKPKLKPIRDLPPYEQYRKMVLVLSTAWDPAPTTTSQQSITNPDYFTGLAGLRLEEFGTSAVPVRQQLHVHLAHQYRHKEQCKNATLWSFYAYADGAALKDCGFTNNASSVELNVHGLYKNQSAMVEELAARDFTSLLRLTFKEEQNRTSFKKLRTSGQSFLFVDYDIWSGHPHVSVIPPPPCISKTICVYDLDSTKGMRIGDVSLLKAYVPHVLQLAQNFSPTLETLREILELESDGNTEYAACEWAANHMTEIDMWVKKYKEQINRILIFYCDDNRDFDEYDKILNILNNEVQKATKISNSAQSIVLTKYGVNNCSDINYLKDIMLTHISVQVAEGLIGVIIDKPSGIQYAIETVARANVPIELYNSIPVEMTAAPVWFSADQSLHLALAIHHFIHNMNWTRIAILSENTLRAKNIVDNLREFSDIKLKDYVVPHNLIQSEAENILHELQAAKARIILVNTNYKDAGIILSTAQRLSMDTPENYAWIVNELPFNKTTLNMPYFTISLSYQSNVNLSGIENRLDLLEQMNELWPDHLWPAQAIALANAVLALVNGFKSAFIKNPLKQYNTNKDEVMKLLDRSLIEEPITAIEETLVFVDKWHSYERERLARLRVNITSRTVQHDKQVLAYSGRTPPHDGTAKCILSSGDSYQPTCYDDALVITLLLLVLIPLAIAFILHIRRCHLQVQKNDVKIRSLLSTYLVNRSKVQLYHEIGIGRFGGVHQAILHVQGRGLQKVLVKELNKEENEILREACILAALDHDRIIRLVGVCIDDQPPLVLLEVAFFGDLLQYLRARRYLVEEAASKIDSGYRIAFNKEARHLSAEALTELARQAASALAYLSLRGVIHSDLRASKCLVDANRSLKLAGFGVSTVSTDMNIEIKNQHRRQVCIQGMASECFSGNFSFASDIWAFGILVFELVTLGEKPYGEISPAQIKQFVIRGGNPQLPLDASIQTKELVQLCWQQKPEKRVTAAEIMTYLSNHPKTLRPALGYKRGHQETRQVQGACNVLSFAPTKDFPL